MGRKHGHWSKMMRNVCKPIGTILLLMIASDNGRNLLTIDDRRHAILCHIIRIAEETPDRTVLQHVIDVTKWSHFAAGSKHPPSQARKTWLQQVIAVRDCDIDVIWSQVHDRSTWRSLRPSLVRRSSEWVTESHNWIHNNSVALQSSIF